MKTFSETTVLSSTSAPINRSDDFRTLKRVTKYIAPLTNPAENSLEALVTTCPVALDFETLCIRDKESLRWAESIPDAVIHGDRVQMSLRALRQHLSVTLLEDELLQSLVALLSTRYPEMFEVSAFENTRFAFSDTFIVPVIYYQFRISEFTRFTKILNSIRIHAYQESFSVFQADGKLIQIQKPSEASEFFKPEFDSTATAQKMNQLWTQMLEISQQYNTLAATASQYPRISAFQCQTLHAIGHLQQWRTFTQHLQQVSSKELRAFASELSDDLQNYY